MFCFINHYYHYCCLLLLFVFIILIIVIEPTRRRWARCRATPSAPSPRPWAPEGRLAPASSAPLGHFLFQIVLVYTLNDDKTHDNDNIINSIDSTLCRGISSVVVRRSFKPSGVRMVAGVKGIRLHVRQFDQSNQTSKQTNKHTNKSMVAGVRCTAWQVTTIASVCHPQDVAMRRNGV